MTTIGPLTGPADSLPAPGTVAGWQALEDEAHSHGYPSAQAYLGAYERGEINVGAAGYQPGNPHTGFGQLQAYDRSAARSGESLHDYAESHTPEALGGAVPPESRPGEHPPQPGFDSHALRDEAHLHGFGSVADYVRAYEHGEINTGIAGGIPGINNGFRQVEDLLRVAHDAGESPSDYLREHRHDGQDGHEHPTGREVDPGHDPSHRSGGQGHIDQGGDPYGHDIDPGHADPDFASTFEHGTEIGGGTPPTLEPGHGAGSDPWGPDHGMDGGDDGVAVRAGGFPPGGIVDPDGTRHLPDGSRITPDGQLRIYPNGNVQDPGGNYLGEYHGEWYGPDHVLQDPNALSPGPAGGEGGADGEGRLVHETVHFGGGEQGAPSTDPGFNTGGAKVATGSGGQAGEHGADGRSTGGHEELGGHEDHQEPQHEDHQEPRHEDHGSSGHNGEHHDSGGHDGSAHDGAGMEHHAG